VNPPYNRKSMAGNPPPTLRAPVLDPTLREDDGDVGIIEARSAPSSYPTIHNSGRRSCGSADLRVCRGSLKFASR
jgi:hypothetical protein